MAIHDIYKVWPPARFPESIDSLKYGWWMLEILIAAFLDQYPDARWGVAKTPLGDFNLWDSHLASTISDCEGILMGETHLRSTGLSANPEGKDEEELYEETRALIVFLRQLQQVPKAIRTFYWDEISREDGFLPDDFDEIHAKFKDWDNERPEQSTSE